MIHNRFTALDRRIKLLLAAATAAVLVVGVQVASAATTDPGLTLSYARTDVVGAAAVHFPSNADVTFTGTVDGGGSGQAVVKSSSSGSVALAFALPANFSGTVTVKVQSGDIAKTETIQVGQVLTSTTLRPKTTTTLASSTTAPPATTTTAPKATTTSSTTPASTTGTGKFTIAVIPDTQQFVFAGDTRFANTTQYLVDNKTKLNLAFVTQEGDLMNWPSVDAAQATIADAAMSKLTSAGIKWSAAIGNHDNEATCKGGSACPGKNIPQALRDTTIFNKYFTADKMGAVAGEFESGKVDNSYSTFTAGGEKWMMLSLELWPRTEAVKWAAGVVAAHPDTNVMIVTHHYLNGDGSIGQNNGGYGANSPQYVYDNLVSKYANIKMVFSGHVDTEAARTDKGLNGNTIYSFLLDFDAQPDKGNPLRFVEIDPANNAFKTYVYSPFDGKAYSQYDHSYSNVSFVK